MANKISFDSFSSSQGEYVRLRNEYKDIPPEDFDYILCETMGLKFGQVLFVADEMFKDFHPRITENLNKRRGGVPVEYIFGYAQFMGYTFKVRPGVFFPRNSTETLVEKAAGGVRKNGKILDLCCGSGNVGISLALMTGASVVMSDADPAAVSQAEENAVNLCPAGIVIKSDLLQT